MNGGLRQSAGLGMITWTGNSSALCVAMCHILGFKEAGAESPNCAYQECIGRYTGKGSPKEGDSSGCNWAAYGFFGIPNGKGIIVMDEDGMGTECFDFAGI